MKTISRNKHTESCVNKGHRDKKGTVGGGLGCSGDFKKREVLELSMSKAYMAILFWKWHAHTSK